MALREFVDLRPAELALAQAAERQVDPLTALIQGFQGGVDIARFPQKLEQEALNQQLATAINQAKLQELQRGKIFEVGGSLLQQDPVTGQIKSIFTSPTSTASREQFVGFTKEGLPVSFTPGVGLKTLPTPEGVSGQLLPKTESPTKTSTGKPVSLQFRDVGDAVIGLNPLTGVEVSRTPKAEGKGVRETSQGLFEYDLRNPSQGKIIAGTGPLSPATAGEAFTQERSKRNLESIADLKSSVSPFTTGLGSLLTYVPGTGAADFQANVDTLKANIAFGELQQMRNASKTGGALGQVAVRELELLQSALGALDTRQSPASFLKNLEKIENSISKFEQAQEKSAPPPASTTTPAAQEKIRLIAPDGREGMWPVGKPIPTGYRRAP